MVILLHVVVAALYAAAALALWPTGAPPAPRHRGAGRLLLAAALVVHAFATWNAVVRRDGLDLSFVNAMSLVAGLAVLVAWVTGILRTLPAVIPVVLPVTAVCALLPPIASSTFRFSYADEPWAATHIAVALVGYALLAVVALQALVMMGLERRLHRAIPDVARAAAAPLLTLERYLFRLIGAGFVLLTATLASGILFSEQLFGKPFTLTQKNLFSVAGWLVFGVLLFGRWRYGWRGRTALKWILGGSVLLALGYLGSKFVVAVIGNEPAWMTSR